MPKLSVITTNTPAAMEDSTIKEIAQESRRAAIDLIVQKYRSRLLHHAVYIVKDHQEAVDVTQEVFIKAMRERRFFDAEFKMKAWLFRVTSNLCFNLVRDRKRRGAILEGMQRPTFLAPKQSDKVFAGEQQAQILAAMERLSENHREILMLRYYSDLSYAEISDTLNVRLGTVMSRLSRAKGRLMEVLDAPGVMGL
ncbi:MAG: RNA polymerase sigma factor [Proteobacteria bacterium]|nr:RNA polymerase sigma factor [Pseudomonadota bacterium]